MKALLLAAMLTIDSTIVCQRIPPAQQPKSSLTAEQPKASLPVQHPKPDYSHAGKDIMGESVARFLANNPNCKFGADEQNPALGSNSCVAVDREFMRGRRAPAQITYAGMPVSVQANFYNDVLVNLTFTNPDSYSCQLYSILDALKRKYGEPKQTLIVDGKIYPAEFTKKNPLLFWQDGTITITYDDARICSVSLAVDKTWEAGYQRRRLPPSNRGSVICDDQGAMHGSSICWPSPEF